MYVIEVYLRDSEDGVVWVDYFTNWPTVNEILISAAKSRRYTQIKDILVHLKPGDWQDWSFGPNYGPDTWRNSIMEGDTFIGELSFTQITVVQNEGYDSDATQMF